MKLIRHSWVPQLPGADTRGEFALLSFGDADCKVTNHKVVLLGTFLNRNDLHISNCFAKTLTIENVIDLRPEVA